MARDRKTIPTVNQRIRQLKGQRRVTGGKSVALPPGVSARKTRRKSSVKNKSNRGTFHK